MAVGHSAVSLCAQASRRLGGKTFTSFTDDVVGAGLCGDIYPTLRDSILGGYDWHFLTGKLQLSKDATGPVSGWTNQFALPSDRLHDAPLRVYTSSNAGASVLLEGWEIIGNKLMTEEAEIWVDYAEITDEGLWPAYFVEMMVNAIMAEIALAITDQENTAARLQAKVYAPGGLLQAAKTRNAQDSPNRVLDDSTLVDARFGPL